jgi:hypothetical protein
MKLYSVVIGFLVLTLIYGCTPKSATPPPVDLVGTRAAQLASVMQTQTVAAYSPTPPPATPTLVPTYTDTPPASVATSRPQVLSYLRAPCWTGPGSSYKLVSNVSNLKIVDLLGVGSVPGWYIILNPYFYVPCWISAKDLHLASDIDISVYPVMTPGSH